MEVLSANQHSPARSRAWRVLQHLKTFPQSCGGKRTTDVTLDRHCINLVLVKNKGLECMPNFTCEMFYKEF